MIRKVLSGLTGLVLTLAGLSFVGYWFNAEPSFGPPSFTEKAITAASIVLGVALGTAGIWLIRYSVRRG